MKALKTKGHMKVTWVMLDSSINEKPTFMFELSGYGFTMNISLRITIAL
jgi:hypothetical protein